MNLVAFIDASQLPGGFDREFYGFAMKNITAYANALVANGNRRTGNEFFDFVLLFSTKRATKQFFAAEGTFFSHGAKG
jgi:hypothetical protein